MQEKDSATGEFRQAIAFTRIAIEARERRIRTSYVSLAASYNNLASLQESGDASKAARNYEKAVALQMKLAIADPINRTHQADLARTYNNLGFLASRNKDWRRAELWYGDAIRLQENLVKESPLAGKYRRDLAISYNNLGMAQSRGNKFDEAEASFQKAITIAGYIARAQPNNGQTLSNQGGVWNNLGMVYDRQHKSADAAAAYQQAIHFQVRCLSNRGQTTPTARRLAFTISISLAILHPKKSLRNL